MHSPGPSSAPVDGSLGWEHPEGAGEADRGHAVLQDEGHDDDLGSGRSKTFLLSNIQGLLGLGGKSKTGFLYDQAVTHNSLLVSVTETWLKPEVKDSELLVNFPGYSVLRRDRLNRKCGGVCVFVRDDISAECISSYDNEVCELLVLKIHSLDTILAVIYRPPDTRLSEFSPVLTELERVLADLPSPIPNVVMMGDLNFPSNVMQWKRVDGLLVPAVHGHRHEGELDGVQARLQAQKLCELALTHHMVQLVDSPTHGKEILDIVFTSNPILVPCHSSESFPLFTDHEIVSIKVNFQLKKMPSNEQVFLLDSAKRLRNLNFSKAPWLEIRKKLASVDWSPMSRLARVNPTLAHTWFLVQILPILEQLVPHRSEFKGRSRQHRNRKLIWRKLSKIRSRIQKSTSPSKVAKLLQDKHDLEAELKTLYTNLNESSEAKVVNGMKENVKIFFDYAKSRMKTKSKVGPFLDPESGELNLNPDYTAQCLSDQYSSVFTQPRPEWSIPDKEEFFGVRRDGPTGPILADIDFDESDIELACSELSNTSSPGPDGIPSSLLKNISRPRHHSSRSSIVFVSPIHKGGSYADQPHN